MILLLKVKQMLQWKYFCDTLNIAVIMAPGWLSAKCAQLPTTFMESN